MSKSQHIPSQRTEDMREDLEKDIENYKKRLEHNREILAKKEAFEKLINSPDFKNVINEEFCTKDAADYNLIAHDPSTPPIEKQFAKYMRNTAAGLQLYLIDKAHRFAVAKEMVERDSKDLSDAEHELAKFTTPRI